jgi:hypothetical protein
MKTTQGSIFNIQRQPIAGGTRTTFRLRSADGKETQVETRIDVPYSDGSLVEASGEVDSDLVLQAQTVSLVSKSEPKPPPPPFPWRWVVVGVCVLVVIGLVVWWISRPSFPNFAGTWTLTSITRNGQPLPVKIPPPLIITQNGAHVLIQGQDLTITSTGTLTETRSQPNEVDTVTWSVAGSVLTREMTYEHRVPLGGRLPGTDRTVWKFRRTSS